RPVALHHMFVLPTALPCSNYSIRFCDVPTTGVTVQLGPTLDGIGKYLRGPVQESDAPVADVASVLRDTKTDVLISYLPVGSERRSEEHTSELQSRVNILCR